MTSVTLNETPVHATIISSISAALNREIPKEFRVWANTTAGKRLCNPDLQVVYQPPGNLRLAAIFALEIGFAQDSKSLKEAVDRLLLETPVKVCVMIDVKESPKYRSPAVKDKDTEYKKMKSKGEETKKNKGTKRESNLKILLSQRRKTTWEDSFHYQDEDNLLSPISIFGLQWVGELTGVVQVFAKGPMPGEILEKTKNIVSETHLQLLVRTDSRVCMFWGPFLLRLTRNLAILWNPRAVGQAAGREASEQTKKDSRRTSLRGRRNARFRPIPQPERQACGFHASRRRKISERVLCGLG